MSKPITPNVPTVKVVLRIGEDLYDRYAERAAKFGREAEDEIALRLRDCREHTATTPIYLTDDQRNELAQLAGRGFSRAEDVLEWARKQCSLHVGDVTVPLSTQLADRLRSRTFGLSWDAHVKRVVTESLESYVGLR